MKNHIIEGLRRRMGFNKGFDVPPNGAAGGLSLWWNDLVEVNEKLSSKILIHTEIRIIGVCDWIQALLMYGNPYRAENEDFWK
ncbi:hypothetical protein ACFXTO_032303 [Malus domestica]